MAAFTEARRATLKLSSGEKGQVLTARVPFDSTEADFLEVSPRSVRSHQ